MEFTLKATHRDTWGTGASRNLRRTGHVPAIVYGNKKPTVSVVLDHNEIYHSLKNEAFHSSIVSIDLNGKKESVVVRDFQMHPFKQQVQHIDFQRIDLKKAMQLKVSLHFINADIAPAVKLQGHRILHVVNEVDIRAMPSKMPVFIEVDLAHMGAGEVIRLSNLNLPEGAESVDLLRGHDLIVASTSSKTAAAEEEEVAKDTTAETATASEENKAAE